MHFCYSLREMNFRRRTSNVLLLMLALAISGAARLPQRGRAKSAENTTPLRFGGSMAFSDFDGDGLLDEARLDGSRLRKSVGIMLTGTGKRSFLHFRVDPAIHGSLFAQDIDKDGATDLIWADPFRANDAVVWLGDGGGRFVRVDSSEYAREFAFGNTDSAEPDASNQEIAINVQTNRSLDQALNPKSPVQTATALPNDYPDLVIVASPALGEPTGRDPPTLLS